MEAMVLAYFGSFWGIAVTALLTLGFGLKAYDVFAKSWPASTGRYHTEGKITWSDYNEQAALLRDNRDQSLISYSYRINGELFNGTVPTRGLSQAEADARYTKGARVTVYYSPRRPSCSFVPGPPRQSRILADALFNWCILPGVVLNGLSFFIYYLAHA